MIQPQVDVTIPVHSRTRPIARAVGSILGHTAAPVRVNVVAHNIDPEIIRENLGSWAQDDRLRLLSLRDGIPSPAGPLNFGLEHSTAPFSSILGSDDEFEPGAIDSWLAMQRATGAAFVIARIHHSGRSNDAYPPVRPGRQRKMDAVKDRLSYRSAPLGLISRAHFGELRFTEGMPSGEDLGYVSTMWFSGERVSFDRTGPAYLGHDDAEDRVSYAPRDIPTDFTFLDDIFDTPWFPGLRTAQRQAIAIKLLRTHVFDAIATRITHSTWTIEEAAALARVVDRIRATSPGVDRLLSSIDRTALESTLNGRASPDETMDLLARRWNYKSIPALLPRNPLLALHRQGPFRTLLAGMLVMSPVPRQRRSA